MRHCLLSGRHGVLLAILASGIGAAPAAPVQVEPAFGYRIGDQIVAVGEVAVDGRAKLDADSLPKAGRVNGWLALQEVRVRARASGLQVVRIFQVTASAPEPRLLFLPKAELKFTVGDRAFTEQLEAVPVSVSPLSPTEAVLRSGFGALRPDRDVPEPAAGEALRRAGMLAGGLAGLALLYVAVRVLAMRRRGFAPFAVAARRLRRLARGGSEAGREAGNPRAAYRILHEAFNEVAGRAMFTPQTEEFLATHPRYAAEAKAVRAFFARSEKAFFGLAPAAQAPQAPQAAQAPAAPVPMAPVPGGAAVESEAGIEVAWLRDLARRLARIEQPGR